MSGLVLLAIGPVTGLGWMTIRVIGRRTGPRSDQNAPRVAKTVKGAKPGLMTNLLGLAC